MQFSAQVPWVAYTHAVFCQIQSGSIHGMDETQQFDWYLIGETALARHFSESADGSRSFWVPRSVIESFSKYPAKPGEPPLCLVEIAEWFAAKENLI